MIKLLKSRIEKRILKGSAEKDRIKTLSMDQFLVLLSVIYGFIVKIRIRLYRKKILKIRKLSCPVISIGNIVAGGSGKTPMAIYLAQAVKKMGLKPVVLSRGYRGSMENRTGIAGDGKAALLGPDKAGDEPHMMAKRGSFPVVVGKDRFKSGITAVNAFNPDLIILDDGFQHVQLHRDLNILLLDCEAPLGNGRLLPAGRLRENPDEIEKRADLIIFTRCPCRQNRQSRKSNKIQMMADETGAFDSSTISHSVRSSKDYEKINAMGKPCFNSCHKPFLYFFKAYENSAMIQNNELTLDSLKGKTAFLFSGIADNGAFKETVEESGIKVIEHLEFMDHYRYRITDIKKITGKGKNSGADIMVTTEKDYARFCYDIDWGMDLAVIGINIHWDVSGEKDGAEFFSWIKKWTAGSI